MRLLKQRGALTVEIMSAMTVMDKRIKSSAHVKYPTEKDRPRGAGLNLVASRGTWVSESLKADSLAQSKDLEVGRRCRKVG